MLVKRDFLVFVTKPQNINFQMSEIDDIFSKKPSSKTAASPTISVLEPSVQKKKKKGKKSAKILPSAAVEAASVPEVVVVVPDTKIETNLPEDEENWADSRGKMPRKKTDDGFNIYSQDELRIGLGGDTADCPFDCKCCY